MQGNGYIADFDEFLAREQVEELEDELYFARLSFEEETRSKYPAPEDREGAGENLRKQELIKSNSYENNNKLR